MVKFLLQLLAVCLTAFLLGGAIYDATGHALHDFAQARRLPGGAFAAGLLTGSATFRPTIGVRVVFILAGMVSGLAGHFTFARFIK